MNRDSPPKAFWRAISVPNTVRKPAETNLAGKNDKGPHEIPRLSPFGGGKTAPRREPGYRLLISNQFLFADLIRFPVFRRCHPEVLLKKLIIMIEIGESAIQGDFPDRFG